MRNTRGPATGKVPPHVQDRVESKRRKAEERARSGPAYLRPPAIAGYVVMAILLGLAIGLALSGDPEQEVAEGIASDVAPLANQADALWRLGRGQTPAISQAAAALEATDDTAEIEAHLDTWVEEHQRILDSIEAVEVDPLARPLRELYRAYVRAQLDGVVLLGAAAAHDGSARQELLRASVREFGRALTLLGEARSSLAELGGPEAPEVQVPTVPGLTVPGAPLPSPFEQVEPDAATGEETASDGQDPSGDGEVTEPTPSPTSS